MERATINWRRLGLAVEFYKGHGFEYVEVPWMAPQQIVTAISPAEAEPWTVSKFKLIGGQLIGSGEQGFLSLMHDGKLDPGRYVTCTPCYRDVFLEFMKVELIHIFATAMTEELPQSPLLGLTQRGLLSRAREFFGVAGLRTAILDTDIGQDVVAGTADRPIEVGSYGWRSVKLDDDRFYTWAYGTGLAEPRFSQALARQAG